jgi:hypothetical protein
MGSFALSNMIHVFILLAIGLPVHRNITFEDSRILELVLREA